MRVRYIRGPSGLHITHNHGKQLSDVTYEALAQGIVGYLTDDPNDIVKVNPDKSMRYIDRWIRELGWQEYGEAFEQGLKELEEKCECGSGNNMRCQNHSPWCKLYLRGV